MLLRYPYEVRDAADYFDDIQDVKITKDMLDLAKHIVESKSGHFTPAKFEDHYEAALTELINKKVSGTPIKAPARPRGDNVVDLMDALKRSLSGSSKAAPAEANASKPAKKTKKNAAGQREMLLPISGAKTKAAKAAAKPARPSSRARKAG